MATDGPATKNDDPTAEPCTGCGGNCAGETPEECRGPAPLPWLDPHRCMFFYEGRVFAADRFNDRLRRVEIRVVYQHCLRLLGRVQGGLLYTTTLLPGEAIDVYEYDRFRRVRSEEERVSVHSSFRQTLSALSQTRRFADASSYVQTVTDVRTQTDRSISVGGGLAGFFGGPSGSASVSTDVETTVATGASLHTVTDSFTQNAITSAQSTDAERSVVVSRFEDAEHQQATRRTLRNDNECYAVTYYVRGVSEAYEVTTRVLSIEWRIGDTPWRDIADQDNLAPEIREALKAIVEGLPKPGESLRDDRQITLPTDGTLYEAELAHCSSCEPMREEAMRIRLEQERLQARRACLEAELLELELERRRAATDGVALELSEWPIAALPAPESEDEH
jgi:thermitase